MHTVYSFFGDIACPSFDRFSPIVRFKSHLYHHETLMLYNLSCWNVNFERFVGDSEHEHIEYSRYLCCDACFIFEIFAVLAPTHIDSWIFCAIFFLSCTPIFAEQFDDAGKLLLGEYSAFGMRKWFAMRVVALKEQLETQKKKLQQQATNRYALHHRAQSNPILLYLCIYLMREKSAVFSFGHMH